MYTNLPVARNGFLRASVFFDVRSPAMLVGGGGRRYAGTGRMNGMFFRELPSTARYPRMRGYRTLVFNLREKSTTQSAASTTINGEQFSTTTQLGRELRGVGAQGSGTRTYSSRSDTFQDAPRIYGTRRWSLDQAR